MCFPAFPRQHGNSILPRNRNIVALFPCPMGSKHCHSRPGRGVHALAPLSFEQSLSTLPVSTMPTPTFSVPLPASWPKHAKSATLHVISIAHFALTHVRGWAANSPILRVRLAAERDQLNSEVAMLHEEIRIKDARMAALGPHRRPHYPPCERMAILQLMAARGWSKAQAGRRFLVTDDTVSSWNGRIEEDGPGALVKDTVPVNKFPDFVAAMVTKLKRLFPVMGRRRIADFLARAGLHIAPSTRSSR